LNKETILKEEEILLLCTHVKDIFLSQPTFLELSPPLLIAGKFL
jgi:hypothetical protein